MNKNDRRLGRRLLAIYQETDATAEQRAVQLNAVCTRGCADCCHLLLTTTFPEAVAIAERLVTDEGWKPRVDGLVKRLYAQIELIVQSAIQKNPRLYFTSKQPCVFLDENKACSIYDVRPGVCRHHYVVTDPKLCSPLVDAEVGRVNMQDLGLYVLNEAHRVSKQTGTPYWVGPFQIMLLWALKLLAHGRAAVEEEHKRPEMVTSILALHRWKAEDPRELLQAAQAALQQAQEPPAEPTEGSESKDMAGGG